MSKKPDSVARCSSRLDDVTCPSCAGHKTVTATGIRYAPGFSGPQVVEMPCFVCDGVGRISTFQVARMKLGESFRHHRVFVLGLGLRKAANKWGMKAFELSGIEQGKTVTDWTPPGWLDASS